MASQTNTRRKRPLKPIVPAYVPEPYFDRLEAQNLVSKIPVLLGGFLLVVLGGSLFDLLTNSMEGRHD